MIPEHMLDPEEAELQTNQALSDEELKVKAERLQEEAATRVPRRCPWCRAQMFYLPANRAIIPGHVYSRAGMAELGITGMCEHCFDDATKEPDEVEDDEEGWRDDIDYITPEEEEMLPEDRDG